jgi:hypothetical protein
VKSRHRKLQTVLLLLLALSTWGVATRVIPLLDGSQEPPSDTVGFAAQSFIAKAEKAGARELFPRRLASCQDDLQRARFEMNLQLAGYWSTRDFTRPTRLMDGTQAKAFRLLRDTVSRQQSAMRLAEEAIRSAADKLSEAEALTSVGQQESSIRSHLASASMKLQQARSYLGAGRYEQSLEAAKESSRYSYLAHDRSRQSLARFDDPSLLRSWRNWMKEAIDASSRSGSVSFVVIKEKHRLEVYKASKLVRSMDVELGANSINQKLHAGDRTTPEGLYRITRKRGRGASKYYLALLLDYPNAEDRQRFARAKERGQLTRRTGIGGLIEIHGEGGKGFDWTDGCVAVSNEDMQVLYNEASVGTVVAIIGSDGGDGPVRSILRRAERYR